MTRPSDLAPARADTSRGPTDAPRLPLTALDELWFQVGGTRCNLACNHCFISCHPGNDTFGFLRHAEVERRLLEARPHGVKEYYFTGGEPFLNKDMPRILATTLRYGPATVLTNGTVFTPALVERLRAIAAGSSYSLEIRVSIDGWNAETNDPLRGEGSFAAAMSGVRQLVAGGFLPIITIAQTWDDAETGDVFDRFVRRLRREGYARPRLKILPTIRLGKEELRTRGYRDDETVTSEMLVDFDAAPLLCSRGRTITDRGVAACPILIEQPGAHFGEDLAAALGEIRLDHRACFTCYLHGAVCSNTSVAYRARDR